MVTADVVNKKDSLITRFLQKISPRLAVENQRLASITQRSDVIIQSYSDLSGKIKDEVDENHFSKFINYEKQCRK